MDKLVTIATFTYHSELTVIRAKLESENIECFIQDEMTAQIYTFASNAIGGIKLQVKQSDAIRAVETLKKAGYLDKYNDEQDNFWINLEYRTNIIPLLKYLRIELRLVILVVLFLILVAFIIYLLTIPATRDFF